MVDDLTAARRTAFEVLAILERLVSLMKATGTHEDLLARLDPDGEPYQFVQELFAKQWNAVDEHTDY